MFNNWMQSSSLSGSKSGSRVSDSILKRLDDDPNLAFPNMGLYRHQTRSYNKVYDVQYGGTVTKVELGMPEGEGTYGIVYSPRTNTLVVRHPGQASDVDDYLHSYLVLRKVLEVEGCRSPLLAGVASGTVGVVEEGLPQGAKAVGSCNDECAICYERMDGVRGECVGLECGHLFHGRCLKKLAIYRGPLGIECPMCRRKGTKQTTMTVPRARHRYQLLAKLMLRSCSASSQRASVARYLRGPTQADFDRVRGASGAEMMFVRSASAYMSQLEDDATRMYLFTDSNRLVVTYEMWPLPIRAKDVDRKVCALLAPLVNQVSSGALGRSDIELVVLRRFPIGFGLTELADIFVIPMNREAELVERVVQHYLKAVRDCGGQGAGDGLPGQRQS